MDDCDFTESASDVVAAAREVEPNFSRSRLRRLHLRGKIDRPKQRPRGGYRRGSVALYPTGTAELVCDLLRKGAETPATPDETWRSWWNGAEQTDFAPIRRRLSRLGSEFADAVGKLRGIDGDPVAGAAWAAATQGAAAAGDYKRTRFQREPWFRRARKRVSAAFFPKVMLLMVRLAQGRFTGFTDDEEEDCFEIAMGLDRARVDRLHDADPWLLTDTSNDLSCLADLIRNTRWDHLLNLHRHDARKDIERLRDELKAIGSLLSGATEHMESLFGQWAFGFKLFAAAFQPKDPEQQAMIVLFWAAMRQCAEEGAIDTLLGTASRWQRVVVPTLEALDMIRMEIPAFAAVLSPSSQRRAMKSPAAMERYHAELRRLREQHAAEVSAFRGRHPELSLFAATAESHEADSAGDSCPDAAVKSVVQDPAPASPNR